MTLKVRKLLSIIFILLFLTITPAIMLYAAGYKLGKNGFSVERTGMFIIDSMPPGAKISLNGKAQETWMSSLFNRKNFITTPAKIKNLLPGEYDVSLELDGYWSWRKKLTVSPGASTFAENIFLFKNDLPAEIMSAEIKTVSLSPDKNQVLIISPGKLNFLNLADESAKTINQNGLSGNHIAWSKTQNKIVIDNYLYNAGDLKSVADLGNLAAGAFNFKWFNNILYFRDKTSIYRLNAANLPEKIIGHKNFNDFLIKDGYLYLANGRGSAANLEIIDPASGRLVKNIDLPLPADYSFINQEHNLLNLYDNNRKILYLIDPSAAYQPMIETINNLKTAVWANSNDLLFTNDFEIWLYNLETKEKTLVTRISDIINNAALHPNKNYIIYSTEQTINVIELDEREKRNITELVKFDLISWLALNAEGNILYFSGRIGNSSGFYKLLIQ